MKAYVINLKDAVSRREYMNGQLKFLPSSLSIEFVEAVDGRIMSPQERDNKFDTEKFRLIYMKEARPGEIGCTLSHQKCYRKIVEEDIQSAIIFEDDLIINEDLKPIIPDVEKWLSSDEPRLLLLSGWFWYTTKKNFDSSHHICRVIGGFLTHSYALNLSAAKLMIDERPWYVADSWSMFIKRGINIMGLSPHICDQDWSGIFKSSVLTESDNRTKFDFISWMNMMYNVAIKRICMVLGLFEPAKDMKIREFDIRMNDR